MPLVQERVLPAKAQAAQLTWWPTDMGAQRWCFRSAEPLPSTPGDAVHVSCSRKAFRVRLAWRASGWKGCSVALVRHLAQNPIGCEHGGEGAGGAATR